MRTGPVRRRSSVNEGVQAVTPILPYPDTSVPETPVKSVDTVRGSFGENAQFRIDKTIPPFVSKGVVDSTPNLDEVGSIE